MCKLWWAMDYMQTARGAEQGVEVDCPSNAKYSIVAAAVATRLNDRLAAHMQPVPPWLCTAGKPARCQHVLFPLHVAYDTLSVRALMAATGRALTLHQSESR